jgi:hypothetical protein
MQPLLSFGRRLHRVRWPRPEAASFSNARSNLARARVDWAQHDPAPTSTTYLKGAAFGFAAASIWAGWSAMTRLAVTTNLDALDVAALRFGVAGISSPRSWCTIALDGWD